MHNYPGVRIITVLLASILLSLLVMGCGSDDPTPTRTTASVAEPTPTQAPSTVVPIPTAQPASPPEYGGTLNTAFGAGGQGAGRQPDPYALQNLGMGWSVNNGLIQQKFPFNPSVGIEFEPVLATEYSLSEDGSEWTFNLRQGVTFHDGEVFNADDVVATIKRLLDPEFIVHASTFQLREIFKDARKVDDYTVVLDTGEPISTAFAWIGSVQMPMMPAHLITGDPSAADVNDRWKYTNPTGPGSSGTLAIGTGPFKMVSSDPELKVVVERNENYFRFDEFGNRLPYLDRWVKHNIRDAIRQRAFFLAVELTLLDQLGYDQSLSICGLVRNPGCYPTIRPWGIFATVTNPDNTPFFQDERANKALRYALDYESVNEIVYGPQVKEFGGHHNIWVDRTLFPDSTIARAEQHGLMPWTDPSRRQEFVSKARELVTELGYPDKYNLPSPVYSSGLCFGQFVDAYLRMMDQLRIVGIDGSLECREGIIHVAEEKAGRFSITMPGNGASKLNDPSNMISQYGILNSTVVGRACCWRWGPTQQEADQLFFQAIKTVDLTERNEIYKELERLYADPSLTVHSQGMNVNYLPVHGCVRNFNPGGHSAAVYWAYESVWLSAECREE